MSSSDAAWLLSNATAAVAHCPATGCKPVGSILATIAVSLARIYTIVIFGYWVISSGLLTQPMKGGIAKYTGSISLPAVVFYFIASADLSVISAPAIGAVIAGKVFCFFCAASFGYMLRRGTEGALSSAGIFGLFASVSSDPAFGGQFMYTLYPAGQQDSPPGTLIIVYFGISLIVCCPMGFFMLEFDKYNRNLAAEQKKLEEDSGSSSDTKKEGDGKSHGCLDPGTVAACKAAFKGTITNPVVLAAIIALIWNLAFGPVTNGVTYYFCSYAFVFAKSFGGPALMLLGMNAVGKLQLFKGKMAAQVFVLVVIKNVIGPIVLEQLYAGFAGGAVESKQKSYLFTYGSFPTAPAIPIWAMMYKAEVPVIAVSMIICFVMAGLMTFFSVVSSFSTLLFP